MQIVGTIIFIFCFPYNKYFSNAIKRLLKYMYEQFFFFFLALDTVLKFTPQSIFLLSVFLWEDFPALPVMQKHQK